MASIGIGVGAIGHNQHKWYINIGFAQLNESNYIGEAKVRNTSNNIEFRRKAFALACFVTASFVMYSIWIRVGFFGPIREEFYPYIIALALTLIVAWVSVKLSKIFIKS